MTKTPGCQLCESNVPTFHDDEPTIPSDWPRFHLVGHGVSSYNVPCNAEERAKMLALQERLVKADQQAQGGGRPK